MLLSKFTPVFLSNGMHLPRHSSATLIASIIFAQGRRRLLGVLGGAKCLWDSSPSCKLAAWVNWSKIYASESRQFDEKSSRADLSPYAHVSCLAYLLTSCLHAVKVSSAARVDMRCDRGQFDRRAGKCCHLEYFAKKNNGCETPRSVLTLVLIIFRNGAASQSFHSILDRLRACHIVFLNRCFRGCKVRTAHVTVGVHQIYQIRNLSFPPLYGFDSGEISVVSSDSTLGWLPS